MLMPSPNGLVYVDEPTYQESENRQYLKLAAAYAVVATATVGLALLAEKFIFDM